MAVFVVCASRQGDTIRRGEGRCVRRPAMRLLPRFGGQLSAVSAGAAVAVLRAPWMSAVGVCSAALLVTGRCVAVEGVMARVLPRGERCPLPGGVGGDAGFGGQRYSQSRHRCAARRSITAPALVVSTSPFPSRDQALGTSRISPHRLGSLSSLWGQPGRCATFCGLTRMRAWIRPPDLWRPAGVFTLPHWQLASLAPLHCHAFCIDHRRGDVSCPSHPARPCNAVVPHSPRGSAVRWGVARRWFTRTTDAMVHLHPALAFAAAGDIRANLRRVTVRGADPHRSDRARAWCR